MPHVGYLLCCSCARCPQGSPRLEAGSGAAGFSQLESGDVSLPGHSPRSDEGFPAAGAVEEQWHRDWLAEPSRALLCLSSTISCSWCQELLEAVLGGHQAVRDPEGQSSCPRSLRGNRIWALISSSPLQVYNEQIHDLLEPKGPLAIREDPEKGVVVQGLSFHQVGIKPGTR